MFVANDHRQKRRKKIQFVMKKYLFIGSCIFFAMQKEEYTIEKEKKGFFIASNLPYRLKLRQIKVTKILTDEKFSPTKIITDKKFSPTIFITTYFFIKKGRTKSQGHLKFIT